MCPIVLYKKFGIANAKAKGAKLGRPQTTKENIPPIFYRHYPAYVNRTLTITEIAKVCNLSSNMLYKYIGKLKNPPV